MQKIQTTFFFLAMILLIEFSISLKSRLRLKKQQFKCIWYADIHGGYAQCESRCTDDYECGKGQKCIWHADIHGGYGQCESRCKNDSDCQ